jgi:Tfp pilus assembly protein PilV
MRRIARRIAARARSESGQSLLELVISLSFLAIAVGALLSMMAAGALAVERSDQKGTALSVAEKQLELYRTLAYSNIRLSKSSIDAISGSDPYMTAHSSDSTIPAGASSGQVTDVSPQPSCSALPPECQPTQTVTGPDHRRYRIDTYIVSVTPKDSGGAVIGRAIKQVSVVVRDATRSTLAILARSASTFDQSNIATG